VEAGVEDEVGEVVLVRGRVGAGRWRGMGVREVQVGLGGEEEERVVVGPEKGEAGRVEAGGVVG
jgi:hypothetical protein